MSDIAGARRIVLIVHYFPPINSSGAKRMEAMAKYFARVGRTVTVITTAKTAADGDFTEQFPEGVAVHQIDWLGRPRDSIQAANAPGYATTTKARAIRKLKDLVMRWFGQLPDPRLPFAFSFLSPFLAADVRRAFQSADIVVASTPPWPTLLAALFARWRFHKPVVLDYRDHFSLCHEMPGGIAAKTVERWIDRALARRAAGLVTISEPMAGYYAEFNPHVAVVLNGYDPELIDDVKKNTRWQPRAAGSPLTIRYLGIITLGRIPTHLLTALLSLHRQGRIDESSVRFEFYGECALLREVLFKEYPALLSMFAFLPRVPYRESMELAITADHLLFCETSITAKASESISAQGILTTKLFEYLASGRPVLADIAPDTLAGQFIRKAGEHHFISNCPKTFEEFLLSRQFWDPVASTDHPFVATLSRVSQAQQYLLELDSLSQPQ